MDIWISSILAMTNGVVNNIIVQMYSCASVKCLWELILEATVSLFCLGLIELLETAMLYLAPNLRKIWAFLLFWLCLAAARILIPSPGTEPVSPEVEAWSPNCWTARGFAKLEHFLKKYFFSGLFLLFFPLSGTTITRKLSLLMLHKFLRFSSLFFQSPPSTPHSSDQMLPIEFADSFIFSTIFNLLLGPFHLFIFLISDIVFRSRISIWFFFKVSIFLLRCPICSCFFSSFSLCLGT